MSESAPLSDWVVVSDDPEAVVCMTVGSATFCNFFSSTIETGTDHVRNPRRPGLGTCSGPPMSQFFVAVLADDMMCSLKSAIIVR